MIEILNIRKTKDGYLANGYIPLLRNDTQVVQWLKDKKEVLPIFTDEEIVKHETEAKVQEAKMYLLNTDYKVLPDYEPKDEAIIAKRAEARAFIRANDVFSCS